MNDPVIESIDEFTPATQQELSRFVAENAAGEKHPLFPIGGRTSLNFGYPPSAPGLSVLTSKLNRTVDYPARDMTVTVEAGTRVEELAAALREENQQLPIDVPQPHRATVGGIVATNTSGPRRFGYGTLRDYVIGLSAVDAQGRLFSAGGRVVKNVAGYDLCKLLTGSLGTLAVITQLTFKLKPVPETSALLWATFDSLQEIDLALERLIVSDARPVVMDVLNQPAADQIVSEARSELPTSSPVLCLMVEGTPDETNWQIDRLKKELAQYGLQEIVPLTNEEKGYESLWNTLVEYQTLSDEPLTFAANLLPSRTIDFIHSATERGVSTQAHAGNGIVIGHLPDDAITIEKAEEILQPLREQAQQSHGNLVVTNCETSWKKNMPLFGLEEASWPLMQRLKTAWDPAGLLNPGRFIDGVKLAPAAKN